MEIKCYPFEFDSTDSSVLFVHHLEPKLGSKTEVSHIQIDNVTWFENGGRKTKGEKIFNGTDHICILRRQTI